MSESAKAHPEWEFELVGSTFQADLQDLGSLPNVVMRGEQPYGDNWLFGNWDVGMIPFNAPLTLATNPVKVYEYLSAGRPVVATALPELTQAPVNEWVRVASGPEEFIAALEAAVVEARTLSWQGNAATPCGTNCDDRSDGWRPALLLGSRKSVSWLSVMGNWS